MENQIDTTRRVKVQKSDTLTEKLQPKPIDPIHRLPNVKTLCGLSRSSIYRLVKEGAFPAPIKLGERASGWRQSDIESWLESRAQVAAK